MFDIISPLDDLDESGGHDELMVLMPILLGLLIVVIVVVTLLVGEA